MLDWRGNLRFIDFHDDAAMRRFPQIDRATASKQVITIAPDGRWAGGYDAIVLLTEAWPYTGIVREILQISIIRWIGWQMYHLITKYRYRITWLPACHEKVETVQA